MARTLGGFADYGPDATDSLVRAMRTVIVKTLEQTILLPVRNNSQVLRSGGTVASGRICTSGSSFLDRPHLVYLYGTFSMRFAYIGLDSRHGIWYKRHKDRTLYFRLYHLDDHWVRYPQVATIGHCAQL